MPTINKAFNAVLLAGLATVSVFGERLSAQPASGAPAAFERVREVTQTRFKDIELTRDPDKDFATMLVASYEELIYLANTQLEYGSDKQLRLMARRISDDQQKQIDEIKQWQVGHSGRQGQQDKPTPESGPLERRAQMPAKTQEQQKPTPPAPTAASNLPMVKGTVEAVDVANGKVTLDHAAIPNLNMDGMTMPWRVQDPAALSTLKKGDKVQFSADRVNGSLMITKISKTK